MTTKHNQTPVTVAEALDEMDEVMMEMPQEVVREQLAEYGLNYDEVAEEGLKFTEDLLRKDRKISRWTRARRFVAAQGAKMTDLSSRAMQRAQEMLEQGHELPSGAFAGRQEAELTEEERLELLADLAMTELLEEIDPDDEP